MKYRKHLLLTAVAALALAGSGAIAGATRPDSSTPVLSEFRKLAASQLFDVTL
jgi:hypothetical protein